MLEKISFKTLEQQLEEQDFRPDNNGKPMTREQVNLALKTFEKTLPIVSGTKATDYYIKVVDGSPVTYVLYVRDKPL